MLTPLFILIILTNSVEVVNNTITDTSSSSIRAITLLWDRNC
jgi:hypothetical protein